MPLEALDMTDLVIIIRAVYFFAFWIWWRDRPLGGPPLFKQGIGCNAVHLCMLTPPHHLKCCGNDVCLGVTHYPVGLYFSGWFSVDLFSVLVFWYVTFFVKLKGWRPTQKSFGKSLFPLGELENLLQIKNKKHAVDLGWRSKDPPGNSVVIHLLFPLITPCSPGSAISSESLQSKFCRCLLLKVSCPCSSRFKSRFRVQVDGKFKS